MAACNWVIRFDKFQTTKVDDRCAFDLIGVGQKMETLLLRISDLPSLMPFQSFWNDPLLYTSCMIPIFMASKVQVDRSVFGWTYFCFGPRRWFEWFWPPAVVGQFPTPTPNLLGGAGPYSGIWPCASGRYSASHFLPGEWFSGRSCLEPAGGGCKPDVWYYMRFFWSILIRTEWQKKQRKTS